MLIPNLSRVIQCVKLVALLMCVSLATTHCGPTVDFPCEWYGSGVPVGRVVSSRIIYCISSITRNGGTIYKSGSTNEDKIMIALPESWNENLTLERRGENLVVNNQVLQPGETYTQFLSRSIIPLRLSTAKLTITNDNMFKRLGLADAIYAIGDLTN